MIACPVTLLRGALVIVNGELIELIEITRELSNSSFSFSSSYFSSLSDPEKGRNVVNEICSNKGDNTGCTISRQSMWLDFMDWSYHTICY